MRSYFLKLMAFGLFSLSLHADDTEIYLGTANRINPNVIFIFDTSGSMDDKVGSGHNAPTRLSLVKKAAIETIKETSGINLALMRYNPERDYFETGTDKKYRGGYLSTPMLNLDDAGVKTTMESIINAYPADGGTPLTEAVHEALNFLRGNNINYARTKTQSNHSWSYLGAAGNSTYQSQIRNGNQYISPIIDQCQKNHIVLFTDGDSSVDGESNDQIRTWLSGFNAADRPASLSTNCSSNSGGNTTITNSCIEELAFVMYNSDNSSLPGRQPVHFHAIGGFLSGNSQTFLNNAATHGGGISASAQDYDELKSALTKIFDDISRSAGTFAAPAVAVNAFNSLEQLDQLYYSVFKPHASVGWSGNLKRFRMSSDGVIVDSNNNPAIDNLTGFFSKNAQSFWTLNTDAPDGDNVDKGGAASRLTTSRKVYTNLHPEALTNTKNRVQASNSANISKAALGNSNLTNNQHTTALNWLAGLDTNGLGPTYARRGIEDPLHSRPVLVNYGQRTVNGKKIPDSVVFLGTNSGYLHAFDTNETNPQERFAFIPKEMLPVAMAYHENSGQKRYGLDGGITIWHNDTNRDQIVNNNEKAYLYVGMRRGGSSYYALDISDRNSPKFLWQINGATHTSTTTGFAKLGQTWSPMNLVDIKWIDGQKRKVLIFGGGYDPAEDNNNVRTAHSMGNAIYMVDAMTGALLWKASNETNANLTLTGMTSGIVGKVTAIDDNGDGLVDLLYAADLGGRIWRIDFLPNKTTANTYASGGMIADLGSDSITNNVRFYNSLDVIYSNYATKLVRNSSNQLVNVSGIGRYQLNIGSGYRAHPLNDNARDNFYVIYDYNISGAPSTYSSISKSNLATVNQLTSMSNTNRNNGFYIPMPSTGEKVLSDAVTLNDTIYFSTYRPVDAESRSGCEADIGKTRLYAITPDKITDRKIITSDTIPPGIPASPVVIVTSGEGGTGSGQEGGKTLLLIGTETIEIDSVGSPLNRTHWRKLN